MLKNRILPLCLVIVCIFGLLTGCTININVDNPSENSANPTDSKTIFDYIFNNRLFKKPMYESRAKIYIPNRATAESSSISSSDLSAAISLAKTYEAMLNTSTIQNKIKEEYPNVEYELTLEPINETEIFAVIVTSEHSEKLEDICNLAVSLLCEKISLIIAGTSCKIVDNATPAQLVGPN